MKMNIHMNSICELAIRLMDDLKLPIWPAPRIGTPALYFADGKKKLIVYNGSRDWKSGELAITTGVGYKYRITSDNRVECFQTDKYADLFDIAQKWIR